LKSLFVTLVLLAAGKAFSAENVPNIPIDGWSEKDPGARIRWETHISAPELSPHQRLMITFNVQVDGVELVKRQGKGNLLMLVQLRDQAGHVYQDSNSISLMNVTPETSRTDTVYSQEAFLIPGDYQVSTGLLFDNTSEHAVQRRTLHVEALRHDPIPGAWRDLPAVEFIPTLDAQDSWYLPPITGHLNLPIAARRPVRLDLLVNGSLTEELPVLRRPSRGRVSVGQLIPALKVLSQMNLSGGLFRMAMLDLERRRIAFEQTLTGDLDWPGLKGALVKSDPNKIDVAALEKSEQNAQFFVSEIRNRVGSQKDEPLHVLIVLSGPMAFGKANLKPIEARPDPNCKIFYIRYHAMIKRDPLRSPFEEAAEVGRRPNRRGDFNFPTSGPLPSDQLFGLIKALDPRLFDITTPAEFRKSLAAILSEIARLSS
jgi:hypothetical protein